MLVGWANPVGRPGCPTGIPTGSPSDRAAPSRSTFLSTGFVDRLFSPKVTRERLREAIWDDLGLSRGRLDPSESRSRVDENAISAKS